MLRYVIPLLLLLTVVACSDDPLETPFAASVQQDSSAMTPFAAGSAQDTLSIVLNMPKAADSVIFQLTNRECASPSNTLEVAQPEYLLLSQTMCQEPIGSTWTIVGPYSSGIDLILNFIPFPGITADVIITGAFPQWQLAFEDGIDAD